MSLVHPFIRPSSTFVLYVSPVSLYGDNDDLFLRLKRDELWMDANSNSVKWGMLFVGFALSRAVTYIMTYLSPPTSILPSRPPSELVSSFCLLSGGIIFMASVSLLLCILSSSSTFRGLDQALDHWFLLNWLVILVID